MTRRMAWGMPFLFALALLVGTQIPGAWRDSIERNLHAPFPLSSLAHLVLFAAMAWQLAARPFAWRASRIVLALLGLALLSEGLQVFAISRHPRWLDIGIDLAGVLLGLGLSAGLSAGLSGYRAHRTNGRLNRSNQGSNHGSNQPPHHL
ncbi:hypothetical protein [Cupriavidus oxalaticus]|uniref:VanZ family protein n=1 Tax=Cupriavidus oxalaticus TaxID=96344 RepID=A0A4P7LS22_9BURK|nr:hypothetical protein [Cupriavidus oxalaticus]QBY55281.1 hypothetical protein E0W60_29760 [Cupriavidus oxalaticus]